MSDEKRLVLSIVQFLDDQLKTGDLSSDAKESLEVAIQCLESAYSINPSDPGAEGLKVSRSLLDIFSEAVGSEQGDGGLPPEASDDMKTEAERLKVEGNALMKAEQYLQALECYSRAIACDGRNAVYYCNRAAAHSKLNHHQKAINDCLMAIKIDPKYVKAYGRMGLAYASLDDHLKASECYAKALSLDPNNESYMNNLRVSEEKIREQREQSSRSSNASSANASAAGPGQHPPQFDLSSLLRNPALMNMATQLMQDPNLQNAMSGLMSGNVSQGASDSPMSGLMSGSLNQGASQDGQGLEALLQAGQQLAAQMQAANPELVEQLRRQMGTPGNPHNPNSHNSSGQ